MNSFVFARHISDCKYKHDRRYRQCNCPKWVEARVNGERIRKSASTRIWDQAELFRQKLEDSVARGFALLETSPAILMSAVDLAVHQFSIWDAVILSAAAEADCQLLLSEDMQDGFVWKGVTVVNPFAKSRNPLLDALLDEQAPNSGRRPRN